MPLLEEVYQVLVEVADAMREGKTITLVPRTQRLTTQEAADFLGSAARPWSNSLKTARSPTTSQAGTAGFPFTDLLAYQERQREDRRAALDRMTGDASEAGNYGGTPENYAAALKTARRRAPPSGRCGQIAFFLRLRRLSRRFTRASMRASASLACARPSTIR